jgi:ABC-type nickel/cobalt efflux system permease component RcnA
LVLSRTARAGAIAGFGHVTTTLLLGIVLWAVGASLAVRYAHLFSVTAALALLGFGVWISYTGWRELHEHAGHEHAPALAHAHDHRHDDGVRHVHWHEHAAADWHPAQDGAAALHVHDHAVAGRTALLLILGSSPMVEGIPAFFAASTYGLPLLATMAAVFAAATILTYVSVSVAGIAGLQRISLGPLERYGEVASGVFVALVGIYALVTA